MSLGESEAISTRTIPAVAPNCQCDRVSACSTAPKQWTSSLQLNSRCDEAKDGVIELIVSEENRASKSKTFES